MTNCIFIGISGGTCSGKTTLSTSLYNFFKSHTNVLLPNKNLKPFKFVIEDCFVISQDDYFLAECDARHKKVFNLNHINWERLGALDIRKMAEDLAKIKNANTNILTESEVLTESQYTKFRLVLVEGFLLFEDVNILNMMQIKIHMHVPVEECYDRRKQRIYNPPDIVGYFEMCVWPSYMEYYAKVKMLDDIVLLNGQLPVHDLFYYARDNILQQIEAALSLS